MAYNLQLYETMSGQPVIERFIDDLQSATKAKLIRQLDLLEAFGPQLGMPHAKPLGGGLYELRVRGVQEVRVLYVFTKNDDICLLHAFQKKTQTTPKQDLDLAQKRRSELQ